MKMGKSCIKFVIAGFCLHLLISCNTVKKNCAVLSLLNDTTIVVASKLLPTDWDNAYYFKNIDKDSISATLHIPYSQGDYIDVGCRFIFIKDEKIVHQEIYWDEYYYRCMIPRVLLQDRLFTKISKQDTVMITKGGGYYSTQQIHVIDAIEVNSHN